MVNHLHKAKRLAVFVIIVTWLLAMMNWRVVHLTRWEHPEWADWMHHHERVYAAFTGVVRYVICPPCAALSEHMYYVILNVEASEPEKRHILHFPYSGSPLLPDGPKIWRLADRNQPWYPVPLLSWYLYWLPPSVLWWLLVGDLFAGKLPFWLQWLRHLIMNRKAST